MLKRTFSLSIFIIICLSILFVSSCKKSETDETSSFTWTYNSTTYTANYTLANSVEDLGPNIIAGTGNATTPGHGVSIKIIPLAVGSYIVGFGATDKLMRFIDLQGNDCQCIGTFNITSVSNKKLSGNFSVTVSCGAGPYTVSGIIKNIPITP